MCSWTGFAKSAHGQTCTQRTPPSQSAWTSNTPHRCFPPPVRPLPAPSRTRKFANPLAPPPALTYLLARPLCHAHCAPSCHRSRARSSRCHGAHGVPKHLHARRAGRAPRGARRRRLALGRPHAGQGPHLSPYDKLSLLPPPRQPFSLHLTTLYSYSTPTTHPSHPEPPHTTHTPQVLFVLTGNVPARVAYLDDLEDVPYDTGSGPSNSSGAVMFSEYSPGEPEALKEATTSPPAALERQPHPPQPISLLPHIPLCSRAH